MSIPSVLPSRDIVAVGASGLVSGSRGGWKPLPQNRIFVSRRVSRKCRPMRVAGLRITACAAPPCPSMETVSSPVIERVGFGGVEFESSALQVVKEGLVFQQARSLELIRAAAYLRAVSFYNIPEGRSEEAVKLHRKMKAADEFSSLRSKVAGLQQGYKRIACILALYPLSGLPDSSVVKLHPSLKVTLANGEEHVVVGSLDLNQGLKVLPGEPAGIKSEMGSSFLTRTASLNLSNSSRSIQGLNTDRERGYLSNVCVAPLMRQRGIGMALLQQAQNMSQLWGITNLYVHAVATNEAAVKLYSKSGFTAVATNETPVKLSSTGTFTLEKEAAVTIARRQARPSRLLLHKFI
ncbi:hypothetical protein M758_1G136000 [Ceratodon purpureus]|uniref:N-acetyltransferase domain-containing protein n=1 Tax=Ceratodon purpureus TaxID=3225 RepID=A0A8T0J4Z3_CERPU|nr:hypothetical protein KC19_1G141100 [Ceratodon purpureus]KAG0629873.1 hypothetical protein M758_1G136000 [Ceratodon purpureus]